MIPMEPPTNLRRKKEERRGGRKKKRKQPPGVIPGSAADHPNSFGGMQLVITNLYTTSVRE
jgi:hypothetical protein